MLSIYALISFIRSLCSTLGVVDVLGRIMILDDLVLYNAHAGFLDRELCKGNSVLVCRSCRRKKYFIDLFLSKRSEFFCACLTRSIAFSSFSVLSTIS